MMSADLLKKLILQIKFKEHYSNQKIDIFSRFSDSTESFEELHAYYLKVIEIEVDEYANVLKVNVESFEPEIAQNIALFVLKEGEYHMNIMGKRLAQEQVDFLEHQVMNLNTKFNTSRQALIKYQNKHGLISPVHAVENISNIVADLKYEHASLQYSKKALSSYQSLHSPAMIKLENQIRAIKKQIAKESAKLTRESGDALNARSAEYQTLELKALFAKESYSGALAALQSTRIEAARKLKHISIIQNPTLPEYPIKPQRIYNIVTFVVMALFLSLITQMIILIIKDHRD
ncbi:MAG: hypothetical protein OFPII_34760 [Osedax symbiont Rs1]|nr:MAG: hypothetical protein OFPII_34760 [Osedax symbiont Rs1]